MFRHQKYILFRNRIQDALLVLKPYAFPGHTKNYLLIIFESKERKFSAFLLFGQRRQIAHLLAVFNIDTPDSDSTILFNIVENCDRTMLFYYRLFSVKVYKR